MDYAIIDLTTNTIAKHPRKGYEMIFNTEEMALDMLDCFGRSPRYVVRPI